MIRPIHAQIGDVLVLTKPLGTQLAVNGHQWYVNVMLMCYVFVFN